MCRSCWGTPIWPNPAPVCMPRSSDCATRSTDMMSRVAHSWHKQRLSTIRLCATTKRLIPISLRDIDTSSQIAPVAQGIEHPPPKRGAGSSNLPGRTTNVATPAMPASRRPIEASPSKRYVRPSGVNLSGPASTSRNSCRRSRVAGVVRQQRAPRRSGASGLCASMAVRSNRWPSNACRAASVAASSSRRACRTFSASSKGVSCPPVAIASVSRPISRSTLLEFGAQAGGVGRARLAAASPRARRRRSPSPTAGRNTSRAELPEHRLDRPPRPAAADSFPQTVVPRWW